jgi:hypothetical protein
MCACGEKLAQDLSCPVCGKKYQHGENGLKLWQASMPD